MWPAPGGKRRRIAAGPSPGEADPAELAGVTTTIADEASRTADATPVSQGADDSRATDEVAPDGAVFHPARRGWVRRLLEEYRIKKLTDRSFYATVVTLKLVVAVIALIGLLFFAFHHRGPGPGISPLDALTF